MARRALRGGHRRVRFCRGARRGAAPKRNCARARSRGSLPAADAPFPHRKNTLLLAVRVSA